MLEDLVIRVGSVSSSNLKTRILMDFIAANPDKKHELARLFYYAYNPYLKFNVTCVDTYNFKNDKTWNYFPEQLELALKNLAARKVSGGTAQQLVVNLCVRFGELAARVINKDLKIGINVKTVLKLFPQFKKEFEFLIQKAEPLSKTKLSFPAYMEMKYNGVRIITIVTEEETTLYSSSGRVAQFPILALQMSQLPNGVYDGELVYKEGKNEHRTTIAGRLNSALKGGRPTEKDNYYHLFDFMTEAEWQSKSTAALVDRKANLFCMLECYDLSEMMIRFAETKEVHSEAEVLEAYDQLLIEGYEGLIIKDPDASYKFRRTADWIKLKADDPADVECYDIAYGGVGSKNEGLIGALKCRATIDGKLVEGEVGIGLSDRDRQRDPNDFIGKIVEITYNSITVNKQGKYSFFIPKFKLVREDKS
jgi:DNA ligase-1